MKPCYRSTTWSRTTTLFAAAAVVAALVLSACAGSASRAERGPGEWTATHTVILVSLDGFGSDYVDRFRPTNLLMLAESGVRAEGLMPVFPTTTFPNHYSMVTGLYPAHHGIVSNTMYDPDRDAWFRIGDRNAVADSAWWGGEPIWVTAEKQGLTAATYFWVGSESAVGGVRPTFWRPYDGSIPGSERVQTALAWLDLPPDQRPSFVSLYFLEVDAAGHNYGPLDARTGMAVHVVDGYLGELIEGLKSRGLFGSVNLLVVSDHGMTSTSPEKVIFLDDFVSLEDVAVIDWSPVLALRPTGITIDSLYGRLLGAHSRLAIFRREELPRRLRYAGNPRIMPIIGIADEGWSITRREGFDPARYGGGAHGYDNALASMRGIFVAHGAAFGTGVHLPALSSVHLYELMADILGVEPAPNDGSLAVTTVARARTVNE